MNICLDKDLSLIHISFPKIEDAKNLRRILNKNGHDVTLVCDSGAQIVSAANSLDGGIRCV